MTENDRDFIFDPSADSRDSQVAAVIEFTSRKWTRPIIEHLLANGSMRYNELREEIDGISDKVLSDSLENLEEFQLVDREVIDDRPVKVEYSLTEAGAGLEPVIDAVADWIDLYLEQVDDDS
jgi:DNA-binding HxlR family transcriptional regulator